MATFTIRAEFMDVASVATKHDAVEAYIAGKQMSLRPHKSVMILDGTRSWSVDEFYRALTAGGFGPVAATEIPGELKDPQ